MIAVSGAPGRSLLVLLSPFPLQYAPEFLNGPRKQRKAYYKVLGQWFVETRDRLCFMPRSQSFDLVDFMKEFTYYVLATVYL